MPQSTLMPSGARKLSEVARKLVLPAGIVTTGWPSVEAQCRKMGVTHDEWQAGLGRAILSKTAEGVYAAGIGGVWISIPRQVGKTFTIGSIIFALCILNPGLKVLWTAHRARTSDETFKSLLGFANRKAIAPFMDRPRQANGQQEIVFKNGSRVMFGAREAGFGRGFDRVGIEVFDECQILSDKALDDMVPATNVSPNPLLLFMGTPPKPSDPSDVFMTRRKDALALLESGEASDMLYVEIGADPDAEPEDRKQWVKANPSYPHRTPEQAIMRMRRNLGADSFMREGLGIWDDDSGANGVIPMLGWHKGTVGKKPEVGGPVVAVDVRTGTEQAFAISYAARVDENRDYIELAAYEFAALEEQWSRDFIVSEVQRVLARNNLSSVVVDMFGEGNPALVPLLEAAGVTVVKLNIADMRGGSVGLTDAIRNGRIVHRDRKPLTDAVRAVGVRKSAEGFIFSQDKSSGDITALRAVTAAWWVLQLGTQANYDVLESFY